MGRWSLCEWARGIVLLGSNAEQERATEIRPEPIARVKSSAHAPQIMRPPTSQAASPPRLPCCVVAQSSPLQVSRTSLCWHRAKGRVAWFLPLCFCGVLGLRWEFFQTGFCEAFFGSLACLGCRHFQVSSGQAKRHTHTHIQNKRFFEVLKRFSSSTPLPTSVSIPP